MSPLDPLEDVAVLQRRVRTDLVIILVSIVLAVVIAVSGAAGRFLSLFGGNMWLGSFIAGIGFTSVFTTAPASVILGTLAREYGIFPVALLGGLGAILGDLVIFRFFRDEVGKNVIALVRKSPLSRFRHIFASRLFHWFFSFVGALIVASPLPDEVGLAMMGLTRMRTVVFVPLSFVLNSAGIAAIGYVARQFT